MRSEPPSPVTPDITAPLAPADIGRARAGEREQIGDMAIAFDRVSKHYSLSLQKQATDFKTMLLHLPRFLANARRPFVALDNVTLQVRRGESLGIIGPNGSGKSTTLRVMARITPPTSGTVTTYGRVSALLELGSGFHPQITRPRERGPQRRPPRPDAQGGARRAAGDHRVLRAGRVHRPADAHVFVRDVLPARLLRRRARRSRRSSCSTKCSPSATPSSRRSASTTSTACGERVRRWCSLRTTC